MKYYLPEIKATIGIILFTVVFILGVVKYHEISDNKLWNGGHCDICGGTWQYEQAVGHRFATSYIYICDGCQKRIEIREIR